MGSVVLTGAARLKLGSNTEIEISPADVPVAIEGFADERFGQAIGGSRWLIASLLGIEIALVGLAGGLIGAFAGVSLARLVGQSVFNDKVEISGILPFVIMFAAMVIALAGAAYPLRRSLRLEPAAILREGV